MCAANMCSVTMFTTATCTVLVVVIVVLLLILYGCNFVLDFQQYLGNDLEDVHGRTIHDDSSVVTLPVYSLNDVVLLPGQLLPLFLYDPLSVSMIKRVLDKDRTFAYIASRYCSMFL